METILVVGGTGMLGAPVVAQLLRDGFHVRVLSRNPRHAAARLGEKVEIVQGDAARPEDVQRAALDCTGVHVSLSGEVEAAGVQNAVRAAQTAGSERITYLSGATVKPENAWFPQTRRKLEAENEIRNSGLVYTIFRPTWFLESLSLYVRGKRAFVFGKQRRPFHFVAAQDFARMVSLAHQRLEGTADRAFVVHGPEPLRFHDALRRYCRVCHPEVRKIATIPYWLARMLSRLRRSPEMRAAADLMAYLERVGEGEDADGTRRVFGLPKTTFEEWLHEQAQKSSSA